MIDLNERPEMGWDVLLWISLAGILVASWFLFAAPKPKSSTTTATLSSVKKLNGETKDLQPKVVEAQTQLQDRTWDCSADLFGSQMLDRLTHMAQNQHLQLSGFRVGKPFPAMQLVEAPFVVVVSGGFMDVLALVGRLEQADSKVAVSQIKIASNSDSDQVTATLALTGFLFSEKH